ncbi:MBL fold metallo-hydrolase [Paenibacillus kobensis]|uniref:MBL fold metallo-hydrolase n=1 Tax=Paenibacillus kobensis TaxID=59841 RepID=UPI000FDCA705|nr:MBL fold metallo-hydrolase [Paenibacillus kobensis]
MIVQKLPWAGIRIQSGNSSVVIDPLFHFPSKFDQSHEPLFPLSEFGPVDAVLITHHHGDHFDPEAIAEFYGADVPVYMSNQSLKFAEGSNLSGLQGFSVGDTIQVGSITVAASYSVDGVGDPQISWIVQSGGKQLIHCGDTLWHGYWWKIVREYGPFDAVCLPVNAAVVQFPGMRPSGQPITMSPEQAVSAAVVLEAKALIPIHFRAIHHPPIYHETPNLLDRLQTAAQDRVELAVLNTNETLTL